MAFDNIPLELRQYKSWVVWKYEDRSGDKPTKVPYDPNTGDMAATNNPDTWGTFEQCVSLVENHSELSGIGFVLSDSDPYAFIDLDDCKGDPALQDKQLKIFQDFNSYAERSPSGQGLHIIVKGSLPQGRRKSCIEIYSSGRYMTMTGDVYRDAPINDYTSELNSLFSQMTTTVNAGKFYLGLEEEKNTDEEVCEMAFNASNGKKFYDLYSGDWENYYSSQSEADFALIDIIAFYTQNRAQIVRIFHDSELGKREKAQRQDYLGWMLNRCFDTMLPPVNIEGIRQNLEEAVSQKSAKKSKKKEAPYSIPLPPGLVGEIAQFVFEAAPRPVQELALVAALGFMGGVCGRAYNISGLGLNQYIFGIASTGVGKEAAKSGISKLVSSVKKVVPGATAFVGPNEFASGQALTRYLSDFSNCFFSISDEFGLHLKEMTGANIAPNYRSLKREILNIYGSSGEGSVLNPTAYSDKDKNTKQILSPNFTLIALSTPETFYEVLDERTIAEGLLPRFSIIEYKGKRPRRNKQHELAQPSFQLIDKIASVCTQSLNLNSQNKAVKIQVEEAALKMLDDLDILCDDKINSASGEAAKHLWTRAHVKALKLAGLISVGCNYINPTVTVEIAQWSIDLVMNEIKNILSKFENGDVGSDNDETSQIAKIQHVISDYVDASWPDVSKYLAESFRKQHEDKLVPYAYIQRRCASVQIFRNDRLGSSNAIKRALKTMCERGDIQEVSKSVLGRDYNSSALSFAISNTKILD